MWLESASVQWRISQNLIIGALIDRQMGLVSPVQVGPVQADER